MFESFKKVLNNIKTLDEGELLDKVYKDPPILDFIETANTQDQLFKGIDATGTTLESIGGRYSPITIFIKQRKGQPTNRVTLKDEGAFYRSVKAKGIGGGEAEITANFNKATGNLQARWGKNLLGLTKQKTDELTRKIIPVLQTEVRKQINT